MWGFVISVIFFALPFCYGVEFKTQDTLDIILNIEKASSTLDDWPLELNKREYNLLCLGETHNTDFRFFYGDLLKFIEFDSMALELKIKALKELLKERKLKKPLYVLNATFDPIMNALDAKKVKVKLYAVEPTLKQNKYSLDQQLKTGKREHTRDGFIAQNIVKNFKNLFL